jgi:hypothetical protein
VRSSLATAVRRAGVLGAAALVCLTTACGPGDLGLGAVASSGTVGATSATGPDDQPPPGAVGEATVDPGTETPGPAPVPTASAEATVPTPTTTIPEAPAEDLDEPAEAEAPAVVPDESVQVAAAGEPGRRSRNSSSGRSTPTPAPAPTATTAPSAPSAATAPSAAGGTSGGASGGSGGSFTDQPRQSFTARNGQTGRYLLYAGGIDPAKPVGLVVYADGTGEYGVNNPSSAYALGGSTGLVATSRARNMITLAVESPNQSCECWHTGDTSGYADFLADLIESQLGDYPVSEVWLTGFSSGAQEVTRFLVPRHPELLRLGGGWVVFGGGGPPADGGAAVTADRMAGVRGHWYTGTADTAVPLTASWGAQAGERWYAGRGVVTSHEWPAGVGHGLDGRLGRTVGQLIDAS